MSLETPIQPSLKAFQRAITDDYAGSPRYPHSDVLVFPAEFDKEDFFAAVEQRDPTTTTVIFVRDDGAELIISPRAPKSLLERIFARIGVVPHDVEAREPERSMALYHDELYARGPRALVRLEKRSFAGAAA